MTRKKRTVKQHLDARRLEIAQIISDLASTPIDPLAITAIRTNNSHPDVSPRHGVTIYKITWRDVVHYVAVTERASTKRSRNS